MLFYMFCWVSGARLFSWFLDLRKKDNVTMARSGVSILLYLSAMFLSVFIPFPAAGITTEVLDKAYPGRESGLWEHSPQQALLAGMFYFGILGLWEFAAPFKGDHKVQPSTLDI